MLYRPVEGAEGEGMKTEAKIASLINLMKRDGILMPIEGCEGEYRVKETELRILLQQICTYADHFARESLKVYLQ